MSFEGQTVLITGGARGQGRSHAVQFARAGADIVICDLCGPLDAAYAPATLEDLENTRRLVEAEDRRCLARRADVRSPDQLADLVTEAADIFGTIDILVANAGILNGARIDKLEPEHFQNVIDTNLSGIFNAVKAVLPGMLAQQYGRIVAISSMAGRRPYGRAAGYAASKWGVIGMIKDIAIDLAKEGITANVVCPASVNTVMAVNDEQIHAFRPDLEHPTLEDFKERMSRFHPQGVAWVEPEDISAVVLFLASDQARRITGDVLTVSAGMMAMNSA
jgi:SDR family mycofactocin-dependent oxidoreductase